MSDSDEPVRSKSARKPVVPLPRLWKTETDEEEDGQGSSGADGAAKKSRKEQDGPGSKSTSKSGSKKAKSKSAAKRDPAVADKEGDNKVLIEATPAMDTYESRRRVRLIIGGLITTCALLVGWITYRTFFYNASSVDVPTEDLTLMMGSAEPRPPLDQEARSMFERAYEQAKKGHTDQAITILNQLVKVYKGTPTADLAQAALDRPKKNLPLFTDRPVVVADKKAGPAEPSAPPPAVVAATPEQPQTAKGEAALILPANPAETLREGGVSPPRAGTPARPLPPGFQAVRQAGVHESGWPHVISCDRDGALMVLIPGATFTMGTNDGLVAERPAHQVRLSTYYIDQHEVTNRQFRLFLAESHYQGQPPGKWTSDEKMLAEPEDLPAVNVNFQDAESFTAWAGKQIPTEAQWEMAARSADGRRFPWGDAQPKWGRPRVARQIDPVMSFPEDKSPYGVFDMAGNVEEWTRDWFDSKYYHSLGKQVVDNPAGPNARPRSHQVAVRGAAKSWSVSHREGVPLDKRLPYVGFRCVLGVEGAVAGAPTVAPAVTPGAPPASPSNPSAVPF